MLPITGVAPVLASARKAGRIDLLSYIGVHKERWEAFHWLVEAMLHRCPSHAVLQKQNEKLPNPLWDTQGLTLAELTRDPIMAKRLEPSSHVLLDKLSEEYPGSGETTALDHRQVLGQLWQGLGCMTLQAEDRTTNRPQRELIMSHVLRVLAHVHHSGILSDSIYNYESMGDGLVIRRPPTLYRLSLRIMTVLSDVAWKLHWIGEMKTAKSLGYELPPPRVQPQLPYVGTEVWLELILWASIEGGWITEAAWLVDEIERRRPDPDLQWSVVSWEELSNVEKPHLTWTALLKREIDRSRLNQATGINIANRGALHSIEMGARTISREVVLAIMDGLVNTASVDGRLYGTTLGKVRHQLSSCKSLLESGRPHQGCGRLDVLLLRAVESSAVNIRQEPDHLQKLLEIPSKKPYSQSQAPQNPYCDSDSDSLDFPAAILGLLHKSLDGLARQANLSGSLRALRLIQDVINTNHDVFTQSFAFDLKERLAEGAENPVMFSSRVSQNPPILYPETPAYTVEALLDLLVDSKNLELGKSLLFNEEVDGGLMRPSMFSQPSLQPSLLRFATATADDHLLLKILETIQAPMPEPILHALLGCQVSLNKWEAVEAILKHFRDTDGMAWAATDAMRIAAAIVALECKDGHANRDQILQARATLQDLVQGRFNSPQKKAQIPDLEQLRKANQLGRIFRTVAGSLGTIGLGPLGYHARSSYSIRIPPGAFQILLDSVVVHQGAAAGMGLWERWCSDSNSSSPLKTVIDSTKNDMSERVVQPTASLLRLIMRPVIENMKDATRPSQSPPTSTLHRKSNGEIASESSRINHPNDQPRNAWAAKAFSRESLSMFDWGIKVYRKLGFAEDKVFGEMPASLRLLMDKW